MLVNCNILNKRDYPNFKESQMKNLVNTVVLLKDFDTFVYVNYCMPDGTGCTGYQYSKAEVEKNHDIWKDESTRTQDRFVTILDDEILI